MRALVQRVHDASVCPEGYKSRSIQKGLCIFIGISNNDKEYCALSCFLSKRSLNIFLPFSDLSPAAHPWINF